jgi:uncharacterized protein (DUF736 family)
LDLGDYEVINNTIKVELAGWKQTSKAGNTYLQLKAQKPREQGKSVSEPKSEDIDDDIPF